MGFGVAIPAGRQSAHDRSCTKRGVSYCIRRKGEDGRVVGASKILPEISGRKRLEQSLLQTAKNAAPGRMATTMAHEINIRWNR